MRDPRHYQIGALSGLLLYGMTRLGFDITPARAFLLLATVLATQAICSAAAKIRFDPRSALISGLSLCLLLRTNSTLLAVLAAVIAIASKFVIRWNGKHLFNPTNGALVAMLIVSDRVWVSPGQWGNVAFFGFLMLCIGGLVVNRASRSDVTYAFIVFYGGLLIARSLWLGEPMTIPLHRLQSGALLLFTFFMISDPKTTPDSRAGRILYAFLVAFGAAYIQFRLFRTNGPLWSLALFSLFVPLLDRLLPAERYSWIRIPGGTSMQRAAAALALFFLIPMNAQAFCGFYVAKGDTKLFNKASQVVLVRDGDRTVMTMANDFQGDPKEFAVVIPVPTLLQRGQINVADKALIDHLDAYSAPRLVEYHDWDPCAIPVPMPAAAPMLQESVTTRRDASARAKGVTIEARYTVGEYDILILSAKESNGLESWLRENGYTIPDGAAPVLASYIRQNMKFFVAKVNLGEQRRLGYQYLRPLQVAYESPKFMLPVRLGTVNAKGPQDLFVYALTKNGRVESTNYRTVKLPTGDDIPLFVRDKFGDFYKSLFTEQVRREDMNAVFLEYAWNMNWCDPCSADPLSSDELRRIGVFWVSKDQDSRSGVQVFATRLHVRYDRAHFPEDLVFQETGDQSNFQARYVMRHPWTGNSKCPAADTYRAELKRRQETEALNLARLTGWKVHDIRKQMNLASNPPQLPEKEKEKSWWESIWQ